MTTVEVRVLGPIEAALDGRSADIGHTRQRHVLGALAVDANRAITTDQLVDRLWGEKAPQQAREVLHSYVSRLRKVLEPLGLHIARRPDGYVLSLDPEVVDLEAFRSLRARAGKARADTEALSLLERALALWRGPALGAWDTDWANDVRESVEAERFAAELDRHDVMLRLGRHAELVALLATKRLTESWDERLTGQRMLALYRSGRPADALKTYEALRRSLAEELGTDPGPSLRQLHRRILNADPGLAASHVAAVAPEARPRVGPPVPRQLPASSAAFTGRGAELRELSNIMAAESDGATGAVISGGGGIGKTWLALRWANAQASRYPDGQLYVDLHGFDPGCEPVPPEVALRSLLYALGLEAAQIPIDLDAQGALLRSLLADRRILMVLDNARDSGTVAPLLPGTAATSVLVTSRRRLTGLTVTHGLRMLTLDVMPDAEARELIAGHLSQDRPTVDAGAIGVILQHCAGLPLALGIAAAQAAGLPPGTPVSAFAADLRAEATRLDALDAGELAVNLRAVLACSTQALTREAARVFALLGLAQGPDISLSAAASLAALAPPTARSVFTELTGAHLVDELASSRYRVHDLVRLFATEQARSDPGAVPAQTRLLDHYLHSAHRAALLLSPHRQPLELPEPEASVVVADLADLDEAMAWFAREDATLVATIQHAGATGRPSYATQLPWTLATYFDRRGHWYDWALVQEVAVEASRELPDQRAHAQALRLHANAYSNLRRYDAAHRALRETLAIFEQLDDEGGRAHVQFDIALLYDREGRAADALEHAGRALTGYRRAANRLGEAVALNAIGWYSCELGQYRAAVSHCEQSLSLATEIDSAYGRSNALDSLGYAHDHLGEHARAVECYQQAIDLFREMGDRHAEAIALDHLGDAQQSTGNRGGAREAWQSALDTLEELGHPDTEAVRAKLRTPSGRDGDT